jgi:hypothetical protein
LGVIVMFNEKIGKALHRSSGRLLLVVCCLGACIGTTPVRGDLFITGVLEASPIDPVEPLIGILEYKAIEFYTDVFIPEADAENYFLRRYQNVKNGVPGGTTDVYFDKADISTGYFYAIRDSVAFDHMYNLDGTDGESWADRTGEAVPELVIKDNGILDIFDGDEAFAIGYQPGGPGTEVFIIDSYGFGEGLTTQPDGSTWNYPNTYAYRIDRTKADGGEFDPANWTIGTPDEFFFSTTEAVVSTTPYGTYVIPEPRSQNLLAFGMVVLLGCWRNFRRS